MDALLASRKAAESSSSDEEDAPVPAPLPVPPAKRQKTMAQQPPPRPPPPQPNKPYNKPNYMKFDAQGMRPAAAHQKQPSYVVGSSGLAPANSGLTPAVRGPIPPSGTRATPGKPQSDPQGVFEMCLNFATNCSTSQVQIEPFQPSSPSPFNTFEPVRGLPGTLWLAVHANDQE